MLYSRKIGTGKDLVLLHGWGFNSDLFANIITQYQHQYRITLIDLPGHGRSDEADDGIQNWCDEIINYLPDNPILLGWSLGGLLAINIAKTLKLSKLILLASSPNFVQNTHWNFGIPADNFKQFNHTLSLDLPQALRRFVSLQTKDKTILKLLNQSIMEFPTSTKALNQGLDILMNTNLVDEFKQLNIPIKVILGKYDILVPDDIYNWYVHQGINVSLLNTGHLPFLHQDFKL